MQTAVQKTAEPQFRMADYEYEQAAECGLSFLGEVLANTLSQTDQDRAAAAIEYAKAIAAKGTATRAPAPPATIAAMKPAPTPVAAPVAAAPPPARPAKIDSSRRQKLATRQLAVGMYRFDYLGVVGVVKNGADGWQLILNDQPGNRRYETKRHAVNAARLFIESQAAAAAAPAPVAASVAVVKPAAKPQPQPQPAPAAAKQPTWRDLAMTYKQANLLIRLRAKLEAEDMDSCSPLADKRNLTRGEASELIDSMKSQLGEPLNSMNRRKYRRSARGPKLATCSIGPFNRGFCMCCGKRQA